MPDADERAGRAATVGGDLVEIPPVAPVGQEHDRLAIGGPRGIQVRRQVIGQALDARAVRRADEQIPARSRAADVGEAVIGGREARPDASGEHLDGPRARAAQRDGLDPLVIAADARPVGGEIRPAAGDVRHPGPVARPARHDARRHGDARPARERHQTDQRVAPRGIPGGEGKLAPIRRPTGIRRAGKGVGSGDELHIAAFHARCEQAGELARGRGSLLVAGRSERRACGRVRNQLKRLHLLGHRRRQRSITRAEPQDALKLSIGTRPEAEHHRPVPLDPLRPHGVGAGPARDEPGRAQQRAGRVRPEQRAGPGRYWVACPPGSRSAPGASPVPGHARRPASDPTAETPPGPGPGSRRGTHPAGRGPPIS